MGQGACRWEDQKKGTGSSPGLQPHTGMASLTAFTVAQCWWGRGGEGGKKKKQRLLPTQGDSEGLDSRVVLPAGVPLPLVERTSRIAPFSLHKMKRSREAVLHSPSPPALTPMAAASGQWQAPLSATLHRRRAHWLEHVTWLRLAPARWKGAWCLSSEVLGWAWVVHAPSASLLIACFLLRARPGTES